MNLVARRIVVISITTIGMTVGPVAVAQPSGTPDYLPIALETTGLVTVIVEKGDHLWKISARHLEGRLARLPTAAEITPYWQDVVDANRDRLRSGDPDLIYPGETVMLPELG